MAFSSPSKSLDESFNSSPNTRAEPFTPCFYSPSQSSSPSSQLRERHGRRLRDSRPVIDRAGSLYLNQGSSPITGIFTRQTGADTNACNDQEGEEETGVNGAATDIFRLPGNSSQPVPELPFADLPRRIADLEERVRYWESVVNGLQKESALGPSNQDHAQKMVKSYKIKLEEARATLHLVPSHVERRLHVLRHALSFTSTPSDLVNIAGAINAYETGQISANEQNQVIFFNGQIVDRIPPTTALNYTARMVNYQRSLHPTGSIWVESPSATPNPLACSASTVNSIRCEAQVSTGEHWYMDHTLQLCWPGGKPYRFANDYPHERPPYPSLGKPYNAGEVSAPVTFPMLVDSGATDILIFEDDLPSMGFVKDVTPMLSLVEVTTAGGNVSMPKYAAFVSYPGTNIVRESSFFVSKREGKGGVRLSGLGLFRDFSLVSAPISTVKKEITVLYGEESTIGLVETLNESIGREKETFLKGNEKAKQEVTSQKKVVVGYEKRLPPKGINLDEDFFEFEETTVQSTIEYVPINKGRKLVQPRKESTQRKLVTGAGAGQKTRSSRISKIERKCGEVPNKVCKKKGSCDKVC